MRLSLVSLAFASLIVGCSSPESEPEGAGAASELSSPPTPPNISVMVDVPRWRLAELEASYASEGFKTTVISCSSAERIIDGVCVLAARGIPLPSASLMVTARYALVDEIARSFQAEGREVLVNGPGFSCSTFVGSPLPPYPQCILGIRPR